RRAFRTAGFIAALNFPLEIIEELFGELLCCRIDQPRAELGDLAADLCFHAVDEAGCFAALRREVYMRTTLGKSGNAARALARNSAAMRRVEIGKLHLSVEASLDRSDLEQDHGGIGIFPGLLQVFAAGDTGFEDF